MHFCFLWDYLPSLKKFPWITAAINLIPFFAHTMQYMYVCRITMAILVVFRYLLTYVLYSSCSQVYMYELRCMYK